ncbi:hypothetical protein GQ53DRAFT_68363 [Thozetella sp. PMI_491]|nr:hypothetical protein GQ53DRAFT_68363 [Thozetella sp. PMI_491]
MRALKAPLAGQRCKPGSSLGSIRVKAGTRSWMLRLCIVGLFVRIPIAPYRPMERLPRMVPEEEGGQTGSMSPRSIGLLPVVGLAGKAANGRGLSAQFFFLSRSGLSRADSRHPSLMGIINLKGILLTTKIRSSILNGKGGIGDQRPLKYRFAAFAGSDMHANTWLDPPLGSLTLLIFLLFA